MKEVVLSFLSFRSVFALDVCTVVVLEVDVLADEVFPLSEFVTCFCDIMALFLVRCCSCRLFVLCFDHFTD